MFLLSVLSSSNILMILINGEKHLSPMLGDSRAILCRNGATKAIQITIDHEPQKEREMVVRRGGFVVQMPGTFKRPASSIYSSCMEIGCYFVNMCAIQSSNY